MMGHRYASPQLALLLPKSFQGFAFASYKKVVRDAPALQRDYKGLELAPLGLRNCPLGLFTLVCLHFSQLEKSI